MSKTIKLRRGLDLHLQGALNGKSPAAVVNPTTVAIVPDDYPGFLPKMSVREGDSVEAGAPLMHDKDCEKINLVSPVSGKVKAIVRGERRKIMRVEVEAETASSATKTFSVKDTASTDNLKAALMEAGLWAMMRQRPYDIVPVINAVPSNIFITAFDSAPLAPSLYSFIKGKQEEMAAGIKALAKLTTGNVYVSTRANETLDLPQEATHIIIEGPHPAGNAGVQADNIAPVNKGEIIWVLDIVTATRIGGLIINGTVDWTTEVALVGSEVKGPGTVTTVIGSAINPIIKGKLEPADHHQRIISGNVLTGVTETVEGYLHYPYRQITVIPEGDDIDEFMGWASMSPKKMSVNHSFISSFLKGKRFAPDARLNGGRRAMIMSEQYDKVMPMDIMPEYLVKAILAKDIDQMEKLGIYEVAPEDFALCEYVDPSKLELQKIVRQGLDYVRKELE